MKIISCMALAICITTTACGSTPEDAKQNSVNVGDNQDQTQLPVRFYLRMSGTIGEDIPITMHFFKDQSTISGNYYYTKVGIPLNISGSIEPSGNIKLEERNSNYEVTGEFSGKFSSGEVFEGTWANPKTKKSLPFRLEKNTSRSAQINFEDLYRDNCGNTKSPSQEEVSSGQEEQCSYVSIGLIKVETNDAQVNSKINQSISKSIWSPGEDAYSSMEDYLNSIKLTPREEYISTIYDCSIVTNDSDILCVDLSWSEDSGGAHPFSANSFLNYDLKSGKEISKKQLFIANYQTKLNQIGERLFTEANGNEEGVWEFTPGKFELNDNFAITMGGLLFHFNQYEIGPYSSGAPDVFIPYKEIQDLILPGGYLDQIRNK